MASVEWGKSPFHPTDVPLQWRNEERQNANVERSAVLTSLLLLYYPSNSMIFNIPYTPLPALQVRDPRARCKGFRLCSSEHWQYPPSRCLAAKCHCCWPARHRQSPQSVTGRAGRHRGSPRDVGGAPTSQPTTCVTAPARVMVITLASSCISGGLDRIWQKISSRKGLSSTGKGWPGKWLRHRSQRHLKDIEMQSLGDMV